jgi:NitT/TauT family transport system substrate-binding protein
MQASYTARLEYSGLWRKLSAVSLVVAALSTGIGSAQAAELHDVTVTQPTADSVGFLPVYVARYNHYFEEAGFNVKMLITNGGGPDMAALISGQAQFSIAGPINQIGLYQQGQRTISVSSVLDRLIANLVVRKEIYEEKNLASLSVDERLKVLQGLKISVTRLGSLTDMLARYYLNRAGVDPSQAQIVATTAGTPQIAAISQKMVDVVSATTPSTEEIVAKGMGEFLVNNTKGDDDAFKPFLQETVVVMPEWAKENPDLVKAFIGAMVKAQTWVRDNPSEESAKIMHSFIPALDETLLTKQIDLMKEGFPTSGCIVPKGVDAVFALFSASHKLEKPMKWDDIATNDYVDEKCAQ